MVSVLTRKSVTFTLVLVTGCTFLMPFSASAQIVQCGNSVPYDCGTCELIALGNNLIDFLIVIMTVMAGIIFVYAGYLMVTSGGNVGQFKRAKQIFTNVVIGLVIMLVAFLIIDIVMRSFLPGGTVSYGGGVTSLWSDIECTDNAPVRDGEATTLGTTEYPDAYLDGTPISEGGMVTTVITPGGTPATITGNLVTIDGRQFDAGIASNVQYLADTYGLRISGGYRTPERNAEVNGATNSYHLTGQAADFVGTQAQMQAAADWARSNGAREVLIHNAGSGTHLHVAW